MAAPSLIDWQARILKGIGAPVTPQNLTFLNAWTKAEGGGATNNPFNTTQMAPGASAYNSVGVRNYGSPEVGLQATIDTLNNGRYGNILGALKQGSDPMAAAKALAASPWGTGSLVMKMLGGGGAAIPSTPSSVPPAGLPSGLPGSGLPSGDLGLSLLGGLKRGDLLGGLVQGVENTPAESAPGSHPVVASSDVSGFTVPSFGGKTVGGDPIPPKFQTSVGGEHPTMGLDGFPAHDYFAKAGSPAVAPVTGKVVRLSGHDPSEGPTEGAHGPFGWSVYIQGDDGHTYYMTHMGSRSVQDGQTVKAGQTIGSVGDYAQYGTPSHIHMGVD
jgi:murein DD-endopeptidase MepM/ murein hydrolase activator NlpD